MIVSKRFSVINALGTTQKCILCNWNTDVSETNVFEGFEKLTTSVKLQIQAKQDIEKMNSANQLMKVVCRHL